MTTEAEEEAAQREFEWRHSEDRLFVETLSEDVERALADHRQTPSDEYMRRTLVRTVFAQLEGLAASVLDWARYYSADNSDHRDRYTEAERMVLRGVVAKLDSKGVAVTESAPFAFMPTKSNFLFALSLAARGAGSPPTIDRTDGGWAALNQGLSVRDRLMHPKDADGLTVNDVELQQVLRGREWFLAQYKAASAAVQKTLAEEIHRKYGHLFRTARLPVPGEDD